VGDVAHGIATGGHRQAQQALALGHVEQFVLDAVGAGTGVEHAADHDVVLLQRAPGGELDVAAAHRLSTICASGSVRNWPERSRSARTTPATSVCGAAVNLVGHRHDGDRQRGGIAADDVDIQPLLLRDGSKGQQQGRKHGKPARHLFHGALNRGNRNEG
jgi:hypothetical protein